MAAPINGPECLTGKEAEDDTTEEGNAKSVIHLKLEYCFQATVREASVAYYILQSCTGKTITVFS